jgi:hypothetical protein
MNRVNLIQSLGLLAALVLSGCSAQAGSDANVQSDEQAVEEQLVRVDRADPRAPSVGSNGAAPTHLGGADLGRSTELWSEGGEGDGPWPDPWNRAGEGDGPWPDPWKRTIGGAVSIQPGTPDPNEPDPTPSR